MDFISMTATDGEIIEIPADCSGMKTGFGYVVNGWSHGVADFDKWSDGDTVIECDASHPCAKPVADAYQELHAIYAQDFVDEAFYLISEGIKTEEEVRRTYADIRGFAKALTAVLAPIKERRARAFNTEPLKDRPFARLLAA